MTDIIRRHHDLPALAGIRVLRPQYIVQCDMLTRIYGLLIMLFVVVRIALIRPDDFLRLPTGCSVACPSRHLRIKTETSRYCIRQYLTPALAGIRVLRPQYYSTVRYACSHIRPLKYMIFPFFVVCLTLICHVLVRISCVFLCACYSHLRAAFAVWPA